MVKLLKQAGIYLLLLFIPVTLILDWKEANAPLIFFSAALSIIPIARLISAATEQLATYTGDALGGLLNATFGNLPELIISFVALRAGLYNMVLASIAGAILANLLLALGLSFLIGGLRHHNQDYNPVTIRVYSTMMLIAVICLMVPSSFHMISISPEIKENENMLNVVLAITLLVSYILYLVFMIKTHPDFFKSESEGEGEEEQENRWSMTRSLLFLLGASVMAAFMSEILVGAAEATGEAMGMSDIFIGVVFLAIIGGAAESISAISMASKNKMDLSIGIALGSSIQIALFIAPLLVLLSTFAAPSQFNLGFSRMLISCMLFSVLLGTIVSGDGRSNWYKGVQLIIVYLIIGSMFFFIPE